MGTHLRTNLKLILSQKITNNTSKIMSKNIIFNLCILALLFNVCYSDTCVDSDFKRNNKQLKNSCNLAHNNTLIGITQCNGLYATSCSGYSCPARVNCRRNVINTCTSQVLDIQINYGCDCFDDVCDSSGLAVFGITIVFAMFLIF